MEHILGSCLPGNPKLNCIEFYIRQKECLDQEMFLSRPVQASIFIFKHSRPVVTAVGPFYGRNVRQYIHRKKIVK